MVIVAASVGVLASRHPEAGSYFVYIGRSFGPLAGALAGWSMISAFFAYMAVGAIWFAVLKVKSPQTLASIQQDMEG